MAYEVLQLAAKRLGQGLTLQKELSNLYRWYSDSVEFSLPSTANR